MKARFQITERERFIQRNGARQSPETAFTQFTGEFIKIGENDEISFLFSICLQG